VGLNCSADWRFRQIRISGNRALPITGDKAWDEVDDLAAAAATASALTNGPVMWLERPDLFKFTLAHDDLGDTGAGPLFVAFQAATRLSPSTNLCRVKSRDSGQALTTKPACR